MKRGIVLFVIMAVLAICSGCGIVGTSTKTRERGFVAEYRTGTQGLVLGFETNMPPAKMYDDQPLEVVVTMENRERILWAELGTRFIFLDLTRQ